MNTKTEIPKLEELQDHDIFAFTIAPSDGRQYWHDHDRLPKAINLIKSALKSQHFEYKLYIETSPTGRIHGHGWLWINNPIGFVIHDVHHITSNNTICIKPIDDPHRWDEYCTKQSHIMQGLNYSTFEKKSRCLIQRFHPLLSEDLIKTTIDDYVPGFNGPTPEDFKKAAKREHEIHNKTKDIMIPGYKHQFADWCDEC